nr:SCO family protein [Steroidobacteraceae bacterium]
MVRTALLFVVCIAVAACQPQKFNGVDITGSSIGPDFSLADHTGTTRKLADFRGKVVVLFFGFMNCPDVCPTALSDMAAVKKNLGRDGARVQVIFVTLDPERDSAALLAQ